MAGISDFSGDVDKQLGSMSSNRTNINNQQQGSISDFLNRYRGAISGQEQLPAMYSRLSQELGIPELQQNVGQLTTTMTNLPATYSAATRGFDVNANQLQRIIGQKSAELAPALTAAQNALSSKENLLGTMMGLYQQQQQKELLPYQSEQSLLNDRLAREYSGFNQDMERELDALITKMKLGVEMSENEKNRANQLAIAEKQYQAELARINAQKESPIALSKGQILINPQTGNKIGSNLGWG